MKYGFVFTNYNNSHYTKDVVYSLSLNSNFSDCYIVIVDNNSEENDILGLKKINLEFPSVKVIFNKNNCGYFKGLNIGITYLKETYIDLDYITIGNNDLFFPLDYLDRLKNIRFLFEQYAVVSPDIITLDGVHQNPHVIKEISKIRHFLYDLYYSNYFLSLIISYIAKVTRGFTARKDARQFDIPQAIHQGYGACYILGPIFFKHFNLLWAPTFLMSEEFFLSRQLDQKNMKVYYEPSVEVNHHDHATMGELPSRKLWQISRDSHIIYKNIKNNI